MLKMFCCEQPNFKCQVSNEVQSAAVCCDSQALSDRLNPVNVSISDFGYEENQKIASIFQYLAHSMAAIVIYAKL